ncbi:MAG: molybdenum cofactor guanylyltransferase MobA [Campylobacterota bacterium]|nr:molybdenum cofactor guanylyltransferase MobA [Campylobacterota bacterium]
MTQTPCVIFAGGRSSRMGEDKALLPFAGFNTLTEFQLSRLSKIFSTIYISCKDKSKFDFKASFIEDIKTDTLNQGGEVIFAPTAGFVAIYQKLKDDSFFALSVDAPFVGQKEIEKIIDADRQTSDATIAKTAFGIQPMCGIYHRSLENKFIQMLKDENHKLGFLLKSSKTVFVNFDNEKPFLNLNHPHEYQEALTFI